MQQNQGLEVSFSKQKMRFYRTIIHPKGGFFVSIADLEGC
jgi:hypothetical protein